MKKRLALFAVATLLLCAPVLAQDPVPVGGQFQVNTYTPNWQYYPAVALDSAGGFVVVWNSYGSTNGNDTLGYSIQGQRYDSNGDPLGSEFQVNTYTSGSQVKPSVAMDSLGNFVVVWNSYGSSDGDSDWSILGQRFEADGDPLGGEFQINGYLTGNQRRPALAVAPNGDFVVVWNSDGSTEGDSSGYSIQGRRYAADGDPLAGQFQINTYTSGIQERPAVAVDASGDFIVTWQSAGGENGDTDPFSIQGRRYTADGDPKADQFLVNSYTTGTQTRSRIASKANGDFVVVWQSYGSAYGDTDQDSIQGRRFDSSGLPVGKQFLVNTSTSSSQVRSSVSTDSAGNFVVVWQNYGVENGDLSSSSIQGQRFAWSGRRLGDQFLVNTYTTDFQIYPTVDMNADGTFVVVWESYGSAETDTDASSSHGQRYVSPVGLLAHWPFDTDASDASGRGNDGVLLGSASITQDGAIGGALDLRGGDGHVGIDSAVLAGLGNCSLAAWVSTESLSDDGFNAIFATDGFTFPGGVHLNLVTPSEEVELAISGYDNVRMELPPDNRWVHHAYVYDSVAGRTDFYQNGKRLGSTLGVPGVPCGDGLPANIGAWDTSGAGDLVRFHDGRIDDLRIYDIKLDAIDVARLVAIFADGFENGDTLGWSKTSSP